MNKYRWPLGGNPLLDFLVREYGIIVFGCFYKTWPPTPPQDLKPRIMRDYIAAIREFTQVS